MPRWGRAASLFLPTGFFCMFILLCQPAVPTLRPHWSFQCTSEVSPGSHGAKQGSEQRLEEAGWSRALLEGCTKAGASMLQGAGFGLVFVAQALLSVLSYIVLGASSGLMLVRVLSLHSSV